MSDLPVHPARPLTLRDFGEDNYETVWIRLGPHVQIPVHDAYTGITNFAGSGTGTAAGPGLAVRGRCGPSPPPPDDRYAGNRAGDLHRLPGVAVTITARPRVNITTKD